MGAVRNTVTVSLLVASLSLSAFAVQNSDVLAASPPPDELSR